jgi:hypothetical protein
MHGELIIIPSGHDQRRLPRVHAVANSGDDSTDNELLVKRHGQLVLKRLFQAIETSLVGYRTRASE